MKVKVIIMPREGLLDPEARAIRELLKQSGLEVYSLRVGKIVELDLRDPSEARLIAEKFLVNPLVEEFLIE
ncbi:MAG: phosphoribosylformylglycinamidine synthase subunit PurS [Aquificaceae bacterium]